MIEKVFFSVIKKEPQVQLSAPEIPIILSRKKLMHTNDWVHIFIVPEQLFQCLFI